MTRYLKRKEARECLRERGIESNLPRKGKKLLVVPPSYMLELGIARIETFLYVDKNLFLHDDGKQQ